MFSVLQGQFVDHLDDLQRTLIDFLVAHSYWVISHVILLTTLTIWSFTRSKPTSSVLKPSSGRNDMSSNDQNKQFSVEELARFDGSDPNLPIYVAIKGIVFDVSTKRDVYGPGGSYHVFAGKDGSKGLGMSSLKPLDAVPDYSSLSASDLKVLDDWVEFFKKRYDIVGHVATDLSDSKTRL